MVFAIIAAVACLAAATIMFSPRMRSFRYYRPFALFFLFEGVWLLLDYAFRQIVPDNVFMDLIHYIGITAIVVFFVLNILLGSDRKKTERGTDLAKRKR